MYLKNAAERGNAERALAPYLRARGSASQLRVVPARYEWAQLERWFAQASAGVLGGLVGYSWMRMRRVTESRLGSSAVRAARIRGVRPGWGFPRRPSLSRRPSRSVAATFEAKCVPPSGGLQIDFPGFLCTLGSTRSATARGHLSPPPTAPTIRAAWKQRRTISPSRARPLRRSPPR